MADEPLQGHIKPSGHINKQLARWEARERGGWQYLARDCREFFTLLGGAVSVFLCVSAAAQEGNYGVGHDKWHQGFYSKLKRNDGQGSCCNLIDCRPPKVASLATTTKLKWTVHGRLFPTTRSIPWSRPMVALMSALRDRWVRTRALYSVSFCLRRADGSMGPVSKRKEKISRQLRSHESCARLH